MNLERLRKVGQVASVGPADLSPNLESLRLAADPELAAAKREWEESEAKARWTRTARRAVGRSSLGVGADQCEACHKMLRLGEAICEGCGWMQGGARGRSKGRGAWVGVPAKTSHVERWR